MRLVLALLSASLLVVAPSWFLMGDAIWAIASRHVPLVVGPALAFLAAAAVLAFARSDARFRDAVRAVSVFLAFLGLYYLVYLLIVPEPRVARQLALFAFGLSFSFVALTAVLTPPFWVAAMGTVGIVILIGGFPAAREMPPAREPRIATHTITAAYGPIRVDSYDRHVARSVAIGGGLSPLDEGFVLATPDGDVYFFEWADDSDLLRIVDLGVPIPVNRERFSADVPEYVRRSWFRVADVHARQTAGDVRLTASHHYWRPDEGCFVLRLSTLSTTTTALREGTVSGTWETLYDTQPCLPLKDRDHRGHPFAGHQAGGRIVELDTASILVTVGDHEFDGLNSEHVLPQDPSVDYGKLLVIHADGSAETVSIGHRNPQGLHIDAQGRIWSTEHGPQGGDELNRIFPGANYGWPYRTHGTDYGQFTWPLSDARDGLFEEPVYAWVPSIAISALTSVRVDRFPGWRDNLLVSSLRAETLYRVELEGERVVVVEPIPIGERIRDVVEGTDGRIVLWTDRSSIISLTPALAPDLGQATFAQCAVCHSIDGQTDGSGPDLWRVYGRRIAARPEFAYSEALRSISGRWTEENLDAFLADPNTFAPGTSMISPGIREEVRRAALIDYLKTLR